MELKAVTSELSFGEGPAWHPEGYLIFSDVCNNRILKYTNGSISEFLTNSGLEREPDEWMNDQPGSNGLAFDREGTLYLCQHGQHAIARIGSSGRPEIVVDSYKGRRLNSPNDLCVGPEGEIIFSDPPYGLKGQKPLPEVAQPVSGVYKWQYGSSKEQICLLW